MHLSVITITSVYRVAYDFVEVRNVRNVKLGSLHFLKKEYVIYGAKVNAFAVFHSAMSKFKQKK